jgi:hypothetical protein
MDGFSIIGKVLIVRDKDYVMLAGSAGQTGTNEDVRK